MTVHKILKQSNKVSDLGHNTATSAGNNSLTKKKRREREFVKSICPMKHPLSTNKTEMKA